MNIKHIFWIFVYLVIFCSQKINCDDDEKFKREISSGYFVNSDVLNKDGKKSNEYSKASSSSSFMSPLSYVFGSLGLSLDKNLKTSVEYWPPDMDKEKFQKAWEAEDSSFPFSSWFNIPIKDPVAPIQQPEISYNPSTADLSDNYNFNYDYVQNTTPSPPEQQQQNQKPKNQNKKPKKIKPLEIIPIREPESYQPVIVSENFKSNYAKSTNQPINIVPVREEPENSFPIVVDYNYNYIQTTTRAPKNDIIYVPSSSPSPTTEGDHSFIYYNEAAKTNSGPIVFPTIEPATVKSSSTIKHLASITVVPRANKKRKLKKKAKTSSPVTQFNINDNQVVSSTAPMNAIADATTTTEKTSFHYTHPTYQIENESIHYTDMINNLSNLTELSYSSNNHSANNVKYQMEIKEDKSIKSKKIKNRLSSKIVVVNDFDVTTTSPSNTHDYHQYDHPTFVINVESTESNNDLNKENYISTEKNDDSMIIISAPKYKEKIAEKKILITTNTVSPSTTSHAPSSTTVRIKKLYKSRLNDSIINIENAINELKKAIDEHDTLKVKDIMQQYENQSSIANIMNAIVMSANIKFDKEMNVSATTASSSEISSSTKLQQHRSRFGSYRNMKAKYIDALKADQHSTTSARTQSSIASFTSLTTVRTKKVKTTASPKLHRSTIKTHLSSSSSPAPPSSSIKSRKFVSTVRQYTPKANKSRQISSKSTTRNHSIKTTTVRPRRTSTRTVL